MASEECKNEPIYPTFCSIQNDWEFSLASLNTNNHEFWISLIQHNSNQNNRCYVDGTVHIDTHKDDNSLISAVTVKKGNNASVNLNWNVKLVPACENKENIRNQEYYTEITCAEYDLNQYHLIPSYNKIDKNKEAIHCLDVAKSSYFKRWYICSGLEHGIINIHDIESSKLKMTCSGHNGHITQCKFFPFGDLILSGDTKGVLNIYAIADPKGNPAVSFHGHKADIRCIGFVGDGSEILSGARDNTIRLWNCSTQKEVMQFGSLGLSTINQVSMISDKILATVSADGYFTCYDIKSGKSIVNIQGCNGDSIECFSVINGDNTGVLLGSDNGLCFVYDIRTINENKMHCMRRIQRDESCVKKVVKYKDNELILCNSAGSIWKWNLNINKDVDIDGVTTACDWTGNDQFGVNDFVIMKDEKSNDKIYVATKNHEIKEYRFM